jgi:hypothetical protein
MNFFVAAQGDGRDLPAETDSSRPAARVVQLSSMDSLLELLPPLQIAKMSFRPSGWPALLVSQIPSTIFPLSYRIFNYSS